MSTHVCPVRKCEWTIDNKRLMCPGHWRLVPPDLKAEVYHWWHDDTNPLNLVHAQLAAINAVNERLIA